MMIRRTFSSGVQSNVVWPRLDAVLKMDTIEGMSGAQIADLWTSYWKQKQGVSAVLDPNVYPGLCRRMQESPLFVAPVPATAKSKSGAAAGEGGWDILLMQSVVKHEEPSSSSSSSSASSSSASSLYPPAVVQFTQLDEYRASPETASPLLTLQYFTELADRGEGEGGAENSLILMNGTGLLDSVSAAFATNIVKLFYLQDGRYSHVYRMNHEPDRFNIDDVLKELSDLVTA